MFYCFSPSKLSKQGIEEQPTTPFSFFYPQKSCANLKVSLTDEGSTHDTPNKENRRYHKTLVLSQYMRMRSTESSTSQRKHLVTKDHSLL